jgi:hypothetical protein
LTVLVRVARMLRQRRQKTEWAYQMVHLQAVGIEQPSKHPY